MERPTFSQRLEQTQNESQSRELAAGERAAKAAELEDLRQHELRQAHERMRRLYQEAADYIASQGIPTERSSVLLGTNGGGMRGYYVSATEFVSVELPEGWVIGRDTSGGVSDVLTPDGKVFGPGVETRGGVKVGIAYERTPESHSDYAVDEHGPYLADLDPYKERDPVNREDRFMWQVNTFLERAQ